MSEIRKYAAIYVTGDAGIRRITFDAVSAEEAQAFAVRHGFGFEGEAVAEVSRPSILQKPQKEAYNSVDTRTKLGDISRKKLYALLVTGKLKRLPDTRRVMVTKKSIEEYLSRAA